MPSGYWSDYKASSFAGGGGTSSNPYLINNAAQLAYLADKMNSGGYYYKINSDIDLSAHYWTPIYAKVLKTAYIDGNGHFISNLYINAPNDEKDDFCFMHVSGGLKLHDIVFRNLDIDCPTTTKGGVGLINVGTGNSYSLELTNIVIDGANIIGRSNYIGVLIGWNPGKKTIITNIDINAASVKGFCPNGSSNCYMGIVTGYYAASSSRYGNYNNININDSYMYAASNSSFTGSLYMGGVIGHSSSYITAGVITLDITFDGLSSPVYSANTYIGGFSGDSSSLSISKMIVNRMNISSLFSNANIGLYSPNITSSYNSNYIVNTNSSHWNSYCTLDSNVVRVDFQAKRSDSYYLYEFGQSGDYNLSLVTNNYMECYNLGSNYSIDDSTGNIFYINSDLQRYVLSAGNPVKGIMILLSMETDIETTFTGNEDDGSVATVLYTTSQTFYFPYPQMIGHSSAEFRKYTIKDGSTSWTSTDTYYNSGDRIYIYNNDENNEYRFAVSNVETSGSIFKYKKDSSTIIEITEEYYKNSSGNLVKVIQNKYKKDSSTLV